MIAKSWCMFCVQRVYPIMLITYTKYYLDCTADYPTYVALG